MRGIKILVASLLLAFTAAAQYVQPMTYPDYSVSGQMNIGNGTKKNTNGTAYLEIGPTSSASKGMLPPRLTQTQRDAIVSPATWLTIINTTTGKWNFYNGSSWVDASASPATFELGNVLNTCLILVNDTTYAVDTACISTKAYAKHYADSIAALKVNKATTLTIDGVTYDLSTNRSWTTSGGATIDPLGWCLEATHDETKASNVAIFDAVEVGIFVERIFVGKHEADHPRALGAGSGSTS